MKRHFKRTVKSWVVGVLLCLAGVIFICMSTTPPTQIDPPWLRVAFALAFVIILAIAAIYAFCFGKLDYDFIVESTDDYIFFFMTEDDIRKIERCSAHITRSLKDKRFLVIWDNNQSTIIPYSPDIQKFIELNIY